MIPPPNLPFCRALRTAHRRTRVSTRVIGRTFFFCFLSQPVIVFRRLKRVPTGPPRANVDRRPCRATYRRTIFHRTVSIAAAKRWIIAKRSDSFERETVGRSRIVSYSTRVICGTDYGVHRNVAAAESERPR